jgi:peptidyl-prolyl cis-trans isomerase D
MLQGLHDKLKGALAYVVLGAIAMTFIFWGINWTLSAPTYAAKVNGAEISANEVRQAYQQQLAQFERQTNSPMTDAQRNDLKKRVMDEFVNRQAIITRSDDLGYRVSDQDVIDEMARVPAFQTDGKFDRNKALDMLRAQGRSIAEIEELFRHDVKLRQLDLALNASSFTTSGELKEIRAITRQQREVRWMTLSAAKYADSANPSDADLKAFYDAHLGSYMTPETVDLHYVELSLEQLSAKVKADDAQLKAYYEDIKSKTPERFTQEEQRRVRHILFSVDDPKQDATVKAKAEGVLKRAQSGEDFGKLAKEFSQDPGSAAQGGDLGWSERKVFVGPFADAAFNMKPDEIRGLVKTQFGYHILKLDGIQPPKVKSFEEARAELETEYKRAEAERLYNDAQDQLADAALQNTTDIDVVARKAGLVPAQIQNFSRGEGGGPLGKSQAVIDAAFSQDVLDGHLSQIVEVEKGRGVVLRSTDHKLPQQKPLEAVRNEVIAAWKKEHGTLLANAAAAEAAKRLSNGEAWDVVAKSLNQPVTQPKFIARSDADVPFEVRTFAFSAPKPAQKTNYESVRLSNGDSAIYALSAVREDPSENGIKDDDLKRQYAGRLASGEAQAYAIGARNAASVQVNPQAIE